MITKPSAMEKIQWECIVKLEQVLNKNVDTRPCSEDNGKFLTRIMHI